MWAEVDIGGQSDLGKTKKHVFLPLVSASGETGIMAGATFQTGRRDFSLPGELVWRQKFACGITWLYCWMWSTAFPLQTSGESATARISRWFLCSSQTPLGKRTTEIDLNEAFDRKSIESGIRLKSTKSKINDKIFMSIKLITNQTILIIPNVKPSTASKTLKH